MSVSLNDIDAVPDMRSVLDRIWASDATFNAAEAEKVRQTYLWVAHRDFWTFRTYLRPKMTLTDNWWQQDVAAHLMWFYAALLRGERPKLILMAPPQHGKSEQVRDFIAWLMGAYPDLKIIFTSYSDQLGTDANIMLQRMMINPRYKAVFPHTRISETAGRGAGRTRLTSNLIELIDQSGKFQNTTIEGQITGFGLDVGVIDDPIKGHAEAMSQHHRNKVWDWLVHNFLSRFADHAGMLMILTRWHLDDPAGRYIERYPNTRVVKYQAIATDDDWSVEAGYRRSGDALFEAHKSYDFLMQQRKAYTQAGWEALYQQNPMSIGGGIFPIDKLTTRTPWSAGMAQKSVRYWDKAGTEAGDGAYTAGVLMHVTEARQYVISDVVRGRWSALEREQTIRALAIRDSEAYGTDYEVVVEQEPGSGGKESAEATIRNLPEFRVYADRPGANRSKEVRAEPFAAQVQGNNVSLVAGLWIPAFIDELEAFPVGKFKDQVDAASGAFSRLTTGYGYNLDAML